MSNAINKFPLARCCQCLRRLNTHKEDVFQSDGRKIGGQSIYAVQCCACCFASRRGRKGTRGHIPCFGLKWFGTLTCRLNSLLQGLHRVFEVSVERIRFGCRKSTTGERCTSWQEYHDQKRACLPRNRLSTSLIEFPESLGTQTP